MQLLAKERGLKMGKNKLVLGLSIVFIVLAAVLFLCFFRNKNNSKDTNPIKGTYEGKKITSDYKIICDLQDFTSKKLNLSVNSVEIVDSNGMVLKGNECSLKDDLIYLDTKKESNNKYNEDCCYVVPAEYDGKTVFSVGSIAIDSAKEIYIEDGIQFAGGIFSKNCERVYLPSSLLVEATMEIKGENIREIIFGSQSRMFFSPVIRDCAKLENITLPDSIKYFYWDMFSNCPVLKSVKLPPALEYIGTGSFYGCTELEELDIPDSVSHIENSFKNCPKLVLIVGKDSYAEKYAIENNLNYKIRE